MIILKDRTKLYNKYIEREFKIRIQRLNNKLINIGYNYQNKYENMSFITGQIHYLNTHKDSFFLDYYRRYMAAYKIQQFWKKCIMNPHCKIGCNHFNLEYDKLYNKKN